MMEPFPAWTELRCAWLARLCQVLPMCRHLRQQSQSARQPKCSSITLKARSEAPSLECERRFRRDGVGDAVAVRAGLPFEALL
jgi:hypothetical protein